MKNVRLLVATGMFLLPGLASVEAAPFYLTNTFDPTDVLFSKSGGTCVGANGVFDSVSGMTGGSCDSLTFGHWLEGFDVGTDTLTDATLMLTFHDDDDQSAEKFNYYVDLIGGDGTVTSESTTAQPFRWSMDVLALVSDSQLALDLSTKAGDFIFERSVLTATIDRNAVPEAVPAPVPEPATLTLLGAGLVAAWRVRRRRTRTADAPSSPERH